VPIGKSNASEQKSVTGASSVSGWYPSFGPCRASKSERKQRVKKGVFTTQAKDGKRMLDAAILDMILVKPQAVMLVVTVSQTSESGPFLRTTSAKSKSRSKSRCRRRRRRRETQSGKKENKIMTARNSNIEDFNQLQQQPHHLRARQSIPTLQSPSK
jgi:hypothetical protein